MRSYTTRNPFKGSSAKTRGMLDALLKNETTSSESHMNEQVQALQSKM
jgi:hypothetical protein